MSYGANMASRLHVSATPREVIKYVHSRMLKKARRGTTGRERREARHQVIRDALTQHEANRDLYRSIYR